MSKKNHLPLYGVGPVIVYGQFRFYWFSQNIRMILVSNPKRLHHGNVHNRLFRHGFQLVLSVQFILCYNLLQIFLSLIFALMRVCNMREKDITQGKA